MSLSTARIVAMADGTPNPTEMVNPSDESVADLTARRDNDAIIMLNVLQFAPENGREFYKAYSAVAGQTVRARGGGPIYVGDTVAGTEHADRWDSIILVRYPRRAAYLDMQSDAAYVGAIPNRTAGLASRLLYPFHQPRAETHDIDAGPDLLPIGGVNGDGDGLRDEVMVVELQHRTSSTRGDWPAERQELLGKAGGDVALHLVGDGPGMVSDGRWDEMLVMRFANIDAWMELQGSKAWSRSNDLRNLVASLSLVTRPKSLGNL